jgi:predicted amidophosphoribosyltransferase
LDAAHHCPVCQARFRGARVCSRCGANLEPLMLLAGQAWALRQAARRALAAGDFQAALELAVVAQRSHTTASGDALAQLNAWLLRHPDRG